MKLPYVNANDQNGRASRSGNGIGIADVIAGAGGFDLFRSSDGIRWTAVTTNGFHNPYNYGARTMAASPLGLFIGTANPFGPEIAVRTRSGWRYEPNPRGGAEVWVGSP